MEEQLGTYIAIKYDALSQNKLTSLAERFDVPNIIPKDKLHTTIIYSTVHSDDVIVNTNPYNSFINKFDTFDSPSGKRCLVVILDNDALKERYKELTKLHGFVSDYPEYVPHITLSYDIEDWDRFDEMNEYIGQIKYTFMLVGVNEYVEDLDLEWTSKL